MCERESEVELHISVDIRVRVRVMVRDRVTRVNNCSVKRKGVRERSVCTLIEVYITERSALPPEVVHWYLPYR